MRRCVCGKPWVSQIPVNFGQALGLEERVGFGVVLATEEAVARWGITHRIKARGKQRRNSNSNHTHRTVAKGALLAEGAAWRGKRFSTRQPATGGMN